MGPPLSSIGGCHFEPALLRQDIEKNYRPLTNMLCTVYSNRHHVIILFGLLNGSAVFGSAVFGELTFPYLPHFIAGRSEQPTP